MHGIGRPLTQFTAARALVAGAALLAGAILSPALGQGAEDSAMAVPQIDIYGAPGGSPGPALPRPLAPSEAARVRRIFTLQQAGEMRDAASETRRLRDDMLLGHILADRYLGTHHRASVAELRLWLDRYAGLPDTPRIHALLRRRLPRGAAAPDIPETARLAEAAPPDPVPEETGPAGLAIPRNPALDRGMAERARAGDAVGAQHLLARTRGLLPAYGALLRAELAQSLFTQNRDREALQIARGAFRAYAEERERVALAGYVAGLAAWRLGEPASALPLFEAASRAGITTPALRAATAFWAARSHLRLGEPRAYAPWMAIAAAEPRSFYGLLARRILRISSSFDPSRETLGTAEIDAVAATPQGLRAFALLQVGQSARAEAELRCLWPKAADDPPLARAVMLVANAAGMMDLAAQLADIVQARDGRPRDELRFPVPRLRPHDGFAVDPALVYALARLESNFDTAAVSPAGARGMMQLMPVTAGYIAGDKALAAHANRLLHDSGYNLYLGQQYVAYLAQQDLVAGDLIRLLACYNAGPGNVARWGASLRDQGDPLLFVEAIPNPETRAFVQRALAYTWIYAARLRLPAPSLDELAAGAFPRFRPLQRRVTVTEAALRIH